MEQWRYGVNKRPIQDGRSGPIHQTPFTAYKAPWHGRPKIALCTGKFHQLYRQSKIYLGCVLPYSLVLSLYELSLRVQLLRFTYTLFALAFFFQHAKDHRRCRILSLYCMTCRIVSIKWAGQLASRTGRSAAKEATNRPLQFYEYIVTTTQICSSNSKGFCSTHQSNLYLFGSGMCSDKCTEQPEDCPLIGWHSNGSQQKVSNHHSIS